MPQTIFPVLRYENARAAIEWLQTAFGFELVFSVPSMGETVRHARLMLAENMIMIASTREEEATFKSPLMIGKITQALCVYVEDIERHYVTAKPSGADILHPLKETDFGSYEYHVLDCEEHLWIFTTPAEIA